MPTPALSTPVLNDRAVDDLALNAPAGSTALAAPSLPPRAAPPASAPAPVEVPAAPDVWEMPSTGMDWCDCGQGHEVTESFIAELIEELVEDPSESITHPEVCLVIMDLWQYAEVCEFFFDAVALSARAVNGEVAPAYPTPVGRRIIGHFTKTWNGCPQEACEGGLDWDDVPVADSGR